MRLSLAFAVSLVLHLLVLSFWVAPFLPDRYSFNGAKGTPMAVVLLGQGASSSDHPLREETSVFSKDEAAGYYGSSAVDVRANPIYVKPLIIPPQAYIDRKRGLVRLKAYIDELGNVRKVDILSAEPEGVYEQAVIDAVTGTIFSPAQRGGTPVKTYKELEINIDPYETISVP